MRHLLSPWLALALVCCLAASPGRATAQDGGKLALQARAVLEKYCYRCHGENGSKEGGMNYILDFEKLKAKKKVRPGKLEDSKVYFRPAIEKDMPPENEKLRPGPEDLAALKRWIEAGAPAATELLVKRPFLQEQDVIAAIHAHLTKTQQQDRPFQRYFTLANLYNNPRVTDKEMRFHRAALAKLLNSLSWNPGIVVPAAIDKAETIFAVDLRDLDWDKHQLWQRVLEVYPYGLKLDRFPQNKALNDQASDVYAWTGTGVPFLRADWFIATAGRPPLYHTLLYDGVLPAVRQRKRLQQGREPFMSAKDLEDFLHVDLHRDILGGKRLARAGMTSSGISEQHRMIERHRADHGAYWTSYDFKPGNAKSNIINFPLGPAFAGNPFNRHAFQQDGGEIIFHLPNGLQGYLLINGKGDRINEGPIDVVSDRLKTSGTNVIVNGLSCMACHSRGIISEFKDTVRMGTSVGGEARDRVQELYVEPEEMARIIRRDDDRFLPALERATGPFLKVGDDARREIATFPEPIGPIARWYLGQELGAAEAARELGIAEPKTLETIITTNGRLQRLGLLPLAQSNTLKRADWERLAGMSLFQEAALELKRGTPVR